MLKKHINYEKLIDISMHNIVRESLKTITGSTIPGNHHFYISFVTSAPGVNIPDHLKVIYPKEMTIVLQYQFDDLEVRKNDFSISLTFNGKKSYLTIPYKAMTSFTDPSVNFGIKFQYFERAYKNKESKTDQNISTITTNTQYHTKTLKSSIPHTNNVIQLNKFQNKNKKIKETSSK